MMSHNLKEEIDHQLEQIQVTPQLKNSILKKASSSGKKRKVTFTFMIACCIIGALSVGVMAGTNLFQKIQDSLDGNYEAGILHAIPPKDTETEQEINDGIKMDIGAAMTDGDVTVVYIAVQDKIGDRLDDSFRFDNFRFADESKAMMNGWSYDGITYDPKEKISIIRFLIDGQDMGGQKIGLRAKSFFSKEKVFDDLTISEHLSDILNENPTSSSFYGGYMDDNGNEIINEILKPDEMAVPINGMDTITITNAAILGDKLNIQMKCRDKSQMQSSIFFHFERADGERFAEAPQIIEYGLDKDGAPYRMSSREVEEVPYYYIEMIYDLENLGLTAEEIAEAKLIGYCSHYESYCEGNWDLTFQIEEVENTKQEDCSIQIGDCEIKSAKISPIGVTLRGRSPESVEEDISISVTLDGKEIEFPEYGSEWSLLEYEKGMNNVTFRYFFDQVTDVSTIDSIMINGNSIIFQ